MSGVFVTLRDSDDEGRPPFMLELTQSDDEQGLDLAVDGEYIGRLFFEADVADGSTRWSILGYRDREREEPEGFPALGVGYQRQHFPIARPPMVERDLPAAELRPGMRTRLTGYTGRAGAEYGRTQQLPIERVELTRETVRVHFDKSNVVAVSPTRPVHVYLPSWEETDSTPDPTVGSTDVHGKDLA